MSVTDQLKQLERRMYQGYYSNVLKELQRLETTELPPTDLFTCLLLKSTVLCKLGDYIDSLNLSGQLIAENSYQISPLFRAKALIAKAQALERLDNYEECLAAIDEGFTLLKPLAEKSNNFIQTKASLLALRGTITGKTTRDKTQALRDLKQSLALYKRVNDNFGFAYALRVLGAALFDKGDFDQALNSYQRSLDLSKELNYNINIVMCLNTLGKYYLDTEGDTDRAIDYYNQSMALARQLNDKYYIAANLLMIGFSYFRKGELDLSLECAQECVPIIEDLNDDSLRAAQLILNAEVFWEKDNLDSAQEYHEQVLRLYEKNPFRFKLNIAETLWALVWLAIKKGSPSQAPEYLPRLQQMYESEDNRQIRVYYHLAKALILKVSPRIKDKALAQDLFREIIQQEGLGYYETVQAMRWLCELLIDELRAYGEPVVLQETMDLVESLRNLTQDQHYFSMFIYTLILQAKLKMIEGDLNTAVALLDQARVTAEDKSIEEIGKKALAEKLNLETQFKQWQHLIQSNATLQARLEQAQIIEYLKEAKKFVDQK